MNDLISVIIPVYDVEDYLDECIKSVVHQTHKNLEIILVDDGSSDKCPEICDSWAEKDSRIKVIHKSNAGAAAARNAALDVANGDYFGFVDSDDYIAENMFEEMLAELKNSGKKISCCAAYRVMTDGSILQMTTASRCVMDTVMAINGIFYGTIDTAVWSKLFDKTVFQGIRFPEGETNEEFPILIPLVYNADGIAHTGKAYYHYRVREGSVTNSSFLQESSSGLVYKNLGIIKDQILKLKLPCKKAYCHFEACCTFNISLAMEKNYDKLTGKIHSDYGIYRSLLRKGFFIYIFSKHTNLKDKILYCLVLTKLLRPLYKVFYKDHL